MPLDVVVKVPSSSAFAAPLDTPTLVLLHHEGHFRILERNLGDFLHLERQLQPRFKVPSSVSTSISSSIEAYCGTKSGLYPSVQLGTRLAIALESFLRHLVSNSELVTTSLAFKTFIYGNILTSHKMNGQSYRDAVETAIETEKKEAETVVERVAAGCSVEHHVAVNVGQQKQLVLWKFMSQGTGLVFSALFSRGDGEKSTEADPYSVSSSSSDIVESETDEKEVAHYKTNCNFKIDESFVYGHYVAEQSGVVTLSWENVDTSSVVSKTLRVWVTVLPLSAAEKVMEIADALETVDTAEWLYDHLGASEIMSAEDCVGWESDGSEDGFGEGNDSCVDEDPKLDSQIQSAVLEERNHELEMQVTRLEENLTAAKKELKSALDRVQIAEEIYKANLETITQLECATVGDTTPKPSRVAMTPPTHEAQSRTLDLGSAQTETTPPNELERLQQLCAGFQEQCLWRSVENMELEAQLAASQIEASLWRDRHAEQAAQVEELEKQNRTLRTHKTMLVKEVKKLQPYSQVNLAALVQEAQEARMVQRSLQAKLDLHKLVKGETTAESEPADFVLVEASDDVL